ncbi:MAG: hypothetical protein ACPKQO_06405 [Nitrososphaeraceae archaeon]
MNKYFLAFFLILFFFTVTKSNVFATHISEPILSLEKNLKYNLNDTVLVNGWVKYNDKPASDVLLIIKFQDPNGIEVFYDEVRSDSNGNFSSDINLSENGIFNTGSFTLIAESQCKDEHRHICHNFNAVELLEIHN